MAGNSRQAYDIVHSQTYDKFKGKLYFQKNEFPLSAPEITV
ncbi:hypothetical protein AC15_0284 [Escherichia coli 2-156-04_S3_C2]|nr:hypothetical protein AC15_0284 [Escherichia coli 2-156-04_S3_C2]